MKRMQIGVAALAFAMHASIALAQTQQPAPAQPVREVDNLKVLMLEALDAPDGKSKAILRGPMFDMAKKYFDARGNLVAIVTRTKRYRQAGCGRLQIVLHQLGVLDPVSKERKTRASVFGLDYCPNGKAPVDKTEV